MVAAALIPPTYVQLADDEDLPFRQQLQSGKDLFGMKHSFDEDPSKDTPGELAPLLENLQENFYPKLGVQRKEKKEQSGERGEEGKTERKDSDPSSTDNKGR